MKKVTISPKIFLFTGIATIGAILGFLASFFLYLSWIAAPVFGVALRRNNMPWFIAFATAAGICLGGIPMWLAVIDLPPNLWLGLLQTVMTALLFLSGAGVYQVICRLKQWRLGSGGNTPPNGPKLGSEIKGDYQILTDDNNLPPNHLELAPAIV